uniref:Nonribosomal peptide synthase n=1 Tax=Streptomyces sp. MJ635-86F5 TaxID=1321967 RepID=X5IIF2_9ACTN|nr:nonribosomal peptide synthase [Streptomyces sp. MJ635-86F5]
MNDTSGPALHARFLRSVRRYPSRPAIRAGTETVRYDEAHALALAWAGELLAAARERPRAVAVLADKGVPAYVGVLAALFAGAAVVPMHPELPAVRIREMLRASAASVALADERGAAVLAETEPGLPVVVADRRAVRTGTRAPDVPESVAPSDLAYILFTSGSTGRPKGVPLTHGNFGHFFRITDQRYDFHADDVFSQVLELSFDCVVLELFSAWGAGGTVCHIPPHAYLDLPSFTAERGVSVWFSTPSAIDMVRRMGGLRDGALPSLRWSFFAGEALKCTDAADWQAAATKARIENLYGPAELTLTITGHRWQPELSRRLAVNGIVPIGAVHPGHRSILLAPDGTESATEGELCVSGPQSAAGYLDPADDEDRFVERDAERWYRTGDRVRVLPNGELAYLGRNDSQVQIHGVRVELPEVDQAVRACPGVADAVTVTRPTGGGLELVVFYTGTPVSPADLNRHLRRLLPDGAIPKAFRHLAEFPLNPNRKVDRIRLAALAAEAGRPVRPSRESLQQG